ncbi:MAG: hypothetical protein KatS3mg111_0882 [Pirellulaceae bacterium]|nr:MAG: hypothetical protein KatS3mg111_0882 [Pirellulaceae bacterium]
MWNIPNALSLIRLALAAGVGLCIEFGAFLAALLLFIIAAGTDFLDGWWARRFNQVTRLGRILDPFVDKVIITAALVALVAWPGSRIDAWMVTVILAREFLVTSIRSMIEGRGGDFSARWLGKWKMAVQCAAIIASIMLLSQRFSWSWLPATTRVLAWTAVLITVASGIDYVAQARRVGSSEPSDS